MEKETASIEVLPHEIQMLILSNLTEAPTLGVAVKNIKAALMVNKKWHSIIYDPKFTQFLISQLAKEFDIEPIFAAIELATPQAYAWLQEKYLARFKTLEDAKGWFTSFLEDYSSDTSKEEIGIAALIIVNPQLHHWFQTAGYDTILLLKASQWGHIQLVKVLLDRGANPNIENFPVVTPLMVAAKNGFLDIVKLLLARGAEVNKSNQSKSTALMYAALRGDNDIVKILLEKGADASLKNVAGLTAAELALRRNHTDTVKIIEDHITAKSGVTP